MREKNSNYFLCGGTFLTLILQSRKPTKSRAERVKKQVESFCEQDVLLSLINIVNPEYLRLQGNSFKTITSDFKNCKIDAPEQWEFGDELVISAFKKCLEDNYHRLLAEMEKFIFNYIDINPIKKKEVLLVKRLIELINADSGLSTYQFVINRDGTSKKPYELMEVTEVDLPAFLLSVWALIVDKRCMLNKMGRDTILAWFPDKRVPKAQAKYKGIDGKSITHEITILPIKRDEAKEEGKYPIIQSDKLADNNNLGIDSTSNLYLNNNQNKIFVYNKEQKSMIISREIFALYYTKLYSNINEIITIALQELFFLLEQGYILHPKCRAKLDEVLLCIITKNKNDRIRRWAYMVASFGANISIINAARSNLKYETNEENKTWIIALISKVTRYDEFLKEMKKCDYGLSLNHMQLASYLFSDYPILNQAAIKRIILNGDDKISLFWIGSIAAYSNIRKRSEKKNIISEFDLYELTAHYDPSVAKHYIGAIWKQDKYSISKMKIDYKKYKEMPYGPKKWFLTAIWKDREFINKNRDYLKELLSDEHLFKYCDGLVREGFARGLLDYNYDSEIVWEILHWYSYEPLESVKFFLYQYIDRYKDIDSNYFEVISINE